jgi:hypothetical protein
MHRRNAGGVGIAEIGDLHRGQMPGEERQSVRHARVAGEIDQDVGRVFANGLFHERAGLADKIPPDRRTLLQPLGNTVLPKVIVIKVEFEAGGIQMLQDRFEKKCAGVRAQVGRQDRHAQPSVGAGVVEKVRRGMRAGDFSICHVFGEELVAGHAVEVVQRKETVAARLQVPRFKFEKTTVGGDRFLDPVRLLESLSPAVVPVGKIGIGGQRPFVTLQGVANLSVEAEREAVVVPTVRVVRLECDHLLMARDRLGEPVLDFQAISEIVPGLVEFRVQLDSQAQFGLGLGGATNGSEGQAQAHDAHGGLRRQFFCLGEEFDGGAAAVLLQGHHAGEVDGVEIARLGRANLAVEGIGLVQPAGAVMHDGLLQLLLDLGGRGHAGKRRRTPRGKKIPSGPHGAVSDKVDSSSWISALPGKSLRNSAGFGGIAGHHAFSLGKRPKSPILRKLKELEKVLAFAG